MKRQSLYIDFIVGVFMLLGVACLAYLSVRLAREDFISTDGYPVYAVFSNISGLSVGAPVEIAGVDVGKVAGIALDEYDAKVKMMVDDGISLTTDVIASIRTKGLFGEKYVELALGGDEEILPAGGTIRDTEPAMDFESLISKFIHGSL